MLKYLAQRADIWLATLADEPVQDETVHSLRSLTRQLAIERLDKRRWLRAAASLATGGSATEGLFASRPLRRTIRQWAHEVRFDAVLAFCSSMVQYANAPELSGVPLVVDLVDVDSQKFFDYAALTSGIKRGLYRLEGRRLRKLECSLAKRARAVALVSQREADVYRAFCPNERTVAIPNGVDLEYFQPEDSKRLPWKPLPPSERTNLAFVGALDYHANVDGVTWFTNAVWPLVRREHPELTLGLIGRNPVPAVQALASIPGIRVFANVPDVRPYLAAADVAIAPLRIARGIQNKVLEAMAMGKPIVCSPAALEGIAAKPGRDLWVCDSPDSYGQAFRLLLREPQERKELGEYARAFVAENYAWTPCLDKLRSVLGLASSRKADSLATREHCEIH